MTSNHPLLVVEANVENVSDKAETEELLFYAIENKTPTIVKDF